MPACPASARRGGAVLAALLLLPALLTSSPALAARDPLGVFGSWGAFRNGAPRHCFAIAEPEPRRQGVRRAFASVASWPEQGIFNQFHARLRQDRKPDTPVMLRIGDDAFALVAGRADAWAANRGMDLAIVRAMRAAKWMRLSIRNDRGKRVDDTYPLRGAATAMDAATVACARRR